MTMEKVGSLTIFCSDFFLIIKKVVYLLDNKQKFLNQA